METKIIPRRPYLVWPSDQVQEHLRYWADELETYGVSQVLRWAFETYAPQLAVISSFGPGSCVLASILAENNIGVPFYHVDTGYHFLETHELGLELQNRYGIQIDRFSPESSVEEFEATHGSLYRHDPGRCCHERKYNVLKQIAPGLKAWICSTRRDQYRSHAGMPVIDWDERFGIIRIAPLARWTKQSVWEKIRREKIPYNPLFDQEYSKIDCAPCTHRDFVDDFEATSF